MLPAHPTHDQVPPVPQFETQINVVLVPWLITGTEGEITGAPAAGAPPAIATLSACVAVLFAASFTCTVNDAVPELVGVPLMAPVDAVSARPGGNVPELISQL